MKKLLVLALVLCMCLSLTACSMEDFEDNLTPGYETSEVSDRTLNSYAILMNADIEDFDVQSTLEATHKVRGISVVIIECGSFRKAAKLEDKAYVIVERLEDIYSYEYSFSVVRRGSFVLIGEDDAIDDALGR